MPGRPISQNFSWGKDEINEPLIRGFRHTLMKIDFSPQWKFFYPLIQNVVEEKSQ